MDRTPPIARGASDSVGHNRKFPLINKCPYFEVWDLRLVERWRDNTGSTGSFHMITPINNPISISREDISVNVDPGCSCLIPACFGKYMINIKENSETTVIKTTL
jgi:mannose-6-phosphate isomerase class I